MKNWGLKEWLSLLSLAILVGAWFYFSRGREVIVKITDQGFAPQTLEIKKGTKVKFINLGEKLHWPASNFHPTHTLYPQPGGCISSKLDACRGLKNGESFAFTFSIPGQWPIHDHLFPGLTMVIKVIPSPSPLNI